MGNFKTFKKDQKQHAIWSLLSSMLCIVPNSDLELAGVGTGLLGDIHVARQGDDFIGLGAAAFGTYLTNMPMTSRDRIVAAQVLSVAASCLINHCAMTEELLDTENVLTAPSLASNMREALVPVKTKISQLLGDARLENAVALFEYISQYNRFVSQVSFDLFKNTGESNEPENEDTERGATEMMFNALYNR